MPASRHARLLLLGLGALVLTATGSLPAAAQGRGAPAQLPIGPQVGVGYVVNAPNMYLGFSAHGLTMLWGGLGLYVDAKFDLDSPSDEPGYIDSLTVRRVEDEIPGQQLFREEDEWRSFNVALIRPLNDALMIYVGAGYADRKRFREYIDDERELGLHGYYWVRNEEESQGMLNVLGGAFFRISSRIAIQVGLESMPRGVSAGATYALPLR